MDLNLLQNFVAVCAWSSVTGAAKAQGLPKSSVSRQLQALEDALGVRLLHRTTRQITPTEAGSELLARARPALEQLGAAAREVGFQDREPAGSVRFTAPQDIGSTMLADIFSGFLRKYPLIQLDGDFSARKVDLVAEGFDCAIRFGPLRDSALVARRVGRVAWIMVASPAFLAKHGTPRTLTELSAAPCILFRANSSETTWLLSGPGGDTQVPVTSQIRGNEIGFLCAMAARGFGVALLPAVTVVPMLRSGELVHILQAYSQAGGEAHILTPTSQFVPHRVRLFVDYVAERLKDSEYLQPALDFAKPVAAGVKKPRKSVPKI